MEGWQRAFVLHSRPWSETSLMLDVFTEESGRVRLVAKGARSKRSNLKGALQPFTPLLLRYSGRGEVKTLPARLNRRCDVSNWRCWVIWGMASISPTVQAAANGWMTP